MKRAALALGVCAGIGTGAAAGAQDLTVPANAALLHQETRANDSHLFATGPWTAAGMDSLTSAGALTQAAWRIGAAGLTTQQVLAPLQAQLEIAGAEVLFSCDTRGCGGFDFRFAIPVLPAPQMQVNLGDFRYLSARLDDPEGLRWTAILVSRTDQASYVQIAQIAPVGTETTEIRQEATDLRASDEPRPAAGTLAERLDRQGRAVLDGLIFATGSAQLDPGPATALQNLADHLTANPQLRVALVGHTDSEGSLDGNIALSKRRAGSVLERLVTDYGVPRRQLEAQGMGYLAPLANNLTPEGRDANRRVEVILLGN